jgi:3-dehydroquinate synthase
VTLDIAGFAASTFLRGLPFLYVPTTLVAQADAAVGGKNGVNHRGYKNMTGVFAQPERVICDHSLLATLDAGDRRNGLVEIIKHAVIGDDRLFGFLEDHASDMMALDAAFTVRPSSRHFPSRPPSSTAMRLREDCAGSSTWGTPSATPWRRSIISLTATPSALASASRPSLEPSRKAFGCQHTPHLDLLGRLEPLRLPRARERPSKRQSVRTKKREGAKIHFVLPESIGRCVTEEIPLRQLEEAIDDLC